MQRRLTLLGSFVGLLVIGNSSYLSAADNFALLIGIDKYSHVRQLRGAVNDIEQIQRLLVEDLKFSDSRIRVLLNERATRANILATLAELARETKAGDTLFWYYSGHGWAQTDQDGDEALKDPDDRLDEVLVPHDATPWPRERALEPNPSMVVDDEINRELSRLIGRRLIVVFDSCHSGTATRALPGEDHTRSLYEGYPLPATPKTKSLKRPPVTFDASGQSIFISAASPVQSASDLGEFEGRRHGAFTASLLRTIRKLGPMWHRNVSWEQLFKLARQDMIENGFGTQTPSIVASDGLGKLTVEKYFDPTAAGEIAVLQSSGAFPVQVACNKYRFEDGDLLELAVESSRAGYLYVFDINAEQTLTQLFPNRFTPSNRVEAGVPRRIPDVQERYQFRAGKPFGHSTVLAIVTSEPWLRADRLKLPNDFQPVNELQKRGLRDGVRNLQNTVSVESAAEARRVESVWSSQRVIVEIVPRGAAESTPESSVEVAAAPAPASETTSALVSSPSSASATEATSVTPDELHLTPEMMADLPRSRPDLFGRLERLAERFSPVFWQDVSGGFDTNFRPWRDFIVRYDFDQTQFGPNWPEPPKFQDETKRARNQSLNALLTPDPQRKVTPLEETPGVYRVEDKSTGTIFQLDLRPVVYWSVLSTPTHYFFHYVVFHAEDWKMIAGHTGDLEGTTIVVDRQSEKMVAAFTLAHDDVQVARSLDDEPEANIGVLVNPALEARGLFDGEDGRPVDGSLQLEAGRDGETTPKEHQSIYIETKGHGHYGPHKIKRSRYILYASYLADESFTAPSFGKEHYPLTDRFSEVTAKHKYRLVYIGSSGSSAGEKSLWGEYRTVSRFPGGVNPPWNWRDNLFFKTGWWRDPRTIKRIGEPRYLINPYLTPGKK